MTRMSSALRPCTLAAPMQFCTQRWKPFMSVMRPYSNSLRSWLAALGLNTAPSSLPGLGYMAWDAASFEAVMGLSLRVRGRTGPRRTVFYGRSDRSLSCPRTRPFANAPYPFGLSGAYNEITAGPATEPPRRKEAPMKILMTLVLSLLLGACATAPVTAPPATLFQDSAFAAPSERVDAADIFALSPEIQKFLNAQILPYAKGGARDALLDALYTDGQLKLEYDAEVTRNAAQAFAARSGNCLSLVVMTAALAKALDLNIRYQ